MLHCCNTFTDRNSNTSRSGGCCKNESGESNTCRMDGNWNKNETTAGAAAAAAALATAATAATEAVAAAAATALAAAKPTRAATA